jgi:hypothetical protein
MLLLLRAIILTFEHYTDAHGIKNRIDSLSPKYLDGKYIRSICHDVLYPASYENEC